MQQIKPTKSNANRTRSLLFLSQPAHVRASQKSSVYNYNYDYNYCIQTFFIQHDHLLPITDLRKLVVKVKENTRQESFGTLRPIRDPLASARPAASEIRPECSPPPVMRSAIHGCLECSFPLTSSPQTRISLSTAQFLLNPSLA